jgi:hypothetical protein
MAASGFDQVDAEDITRRVERTWGYCTEVIERPWIRALQWFLDEQTKAFIQSFAAIRRAYAEGVMAYGMFTARRT